MLHHVLWLFRFHDLNINDSFVAWVNIFSISYPILLKSVSKHGSPPCYCDKDKYKIQKCSNQLTDHLHTNYLRLFQTFSYTFPRRSWWVTDFFHRIKPPANLHINGLVLTCILACDFYLYTLRSAVSPYGCFSGCSFSKSRRKDKMCPCNRTLAWKLMWGCCGWLFNICVCHYQPVIHM